MTTCNNCVRTVILFVKEKELAEIYDGLQLVIVIHVARVNSYTTRRLKSDKI